MAKQEKFNKPLAGTFFEHDGKFGPYYRSATLTAENFDELQKAEVGAKFVLSPTKEGSKAAFTLRVIPKDEVDGWREKFKESQSSNGLE